MPVGGMRCVAKQQVCPPGLLCRQGEVGYITASLKLDLRSSRGGLGPPFFFHPPLFTSCQAAATWCRQRWADFRDGPALSPASLLPQHVPQRPNHL